MWQFFGRLWWRVREASPVVWRRTLHESLAHQRRTSQVVVDKLREDLEYARREIDLWHGLAKRGAGARVVGQLAAESEVKP